MTCWKCGAANENYATNCYRCGALLKGNVSANLDLPVEDNKGVGRYVLAIGILVIVMLAGYFGGIKVKELVLSSKEKKIDPYANIVRVPYASKELQAGEQILNASISYMEVDKDNNVNLDIISDVNDLIGKCIAKDTKVVKGSYFYDYLIDSCSSTPESPVESNEGYIDLSINVKTSPIVRTIVAGNMGDIYIKMYNLNNDLIFGPLIRNVKVKEVSTEENNVTIKILIKKEMEQMLKDAQTLENVEVIYTPKGFMRGVEPTIVSKYLQDELLRRMES